MAATALAASALAPGAPSRPESRTPTPAPAPGPGPGPGRPRRVPRVRAGERALLTRSSRSAPAVRAGGSGVKFTSGPRTVRGPGRGPAERGRDRPRPWVTTAPGRRRRCNPGLTTPTFLTITELEVSGLRGRWAGFQLGRLSLATKRESGPGEGSKERNTVETGPATQTSRGLEIPPEAFDFFLKG